MPAFSYPPRLITVLKADRYLKSHLGGDWLSGGGIYYCLSNMQRPRLAVCLGSGAGTVPALMREGQLSCGDWVKEDFKTCVVDLGVRLHAYTDRHGKSIHDKDGLFRKLYPEIEVLHMSTDDSCDHFKSEGTKIDYLHIDASHTHYQSLKDFENFYKKYNLMSENFIITMHDTAIGHVDKKWDGCVPRTIAEIRRKYKELEIMDFNAPRGLTQPRKTWSWRGPHACGTAIIKPRRYNRWDTPPHEEEHHAD